jgi:hypothetical protein
LGADQISFVAEFLYLVFSRSVRVKAIRFCFGLSCAGRQIPYCRFSFQFSSCLLPKRVCRFVFPVKAVSFLPSPRQERMQAAIFVFLHDSVFIARTKHRSPWQNILFLDLFNQF